MLKVLCALGSLLCSAYVVGITVANATSFDVTFEEVASCKMWADPGPRWQLTNKYIPHNWYSCRQHPQLTTLPAGTTKEIPLEHNEYLMHMKVSIAGGAIKVYNPSLDVAQQINDTVYITAPPNKSFIKFVRFIQ